MIKNLFSLIVLSWFVVCPSTTQAADGLSIELRSISGDFIDTGYAAAEMVATFTYGDSLVSSVPIYWEVVSVENRSVALPSAERDRREGLRWEHPFPSGKKIGVAHSMTDADGLAQMILTDSVGERSVMVAATAKYNGQTYRAEQKLEFGNGPLSIFAAPLPEPVTWLELYAICNGVPYSGDPANWYTGMGLVGGEKMPSLEQMQTISMPSEYNTQPNALAAAAVAGWPTGKRYWNARAVMQNRASHIDILSGNHHGYGGNDVNAKEYGVCLR